jgi:integrase
MTAAMSAVPAGMPGGSPFAGLDICAAAGLRPGPGTAGPVFDQDVWDFSGVTGLPAYLQPSLKRMDFTAIISPAWRLVAKEHITALLAPGHERVRHLPGARRYPLTLSTCALLLIELTGWLNWLTGRGITSLAQVTSIHCHAYAAERARRTDSAGTLTGDSPGAYYKAIRAVSELASYRQLYTADRYGEGLRPADGVTTSGVGLRLAENKTPVVPDAILRPLLSAALYMTGVLGPHVIAMLAGREAAAARRRQSARKNPGWYPEAVSDVLRVIAAHVAEGRPLDQLPGDKVQARLRDGRMRPDDPLLTVSAEALAREAGYRQSLLARWLPQLRPALEDAVRQVGIAQPWARDAALVDRADGEGTTAWSEPLSDLYARDLADYLRTAAIIVIAAISGMRKSELCELAAGCCLPPREVMPGLFRYKIASTLVKGQPHGGTPDEWVVTKEVYDAAGIAAQLLGSPPDGTPLFGRFNVAVGCRGFRGWVNGPAGQRLGLAPVPPGPVNLRMLRRTLAVELAYRPGGLLAAKVHLKHVSVVTTEGYANRPGGSQSRFLSEIGKEEQRRNLDLVQAEYGNYKNGIMPSGPGARDLAVFFAAASGQPSGPGHQPPAVFPGDQQVRAMLAKRARTLHLGPANFCWFTDPARALCLRQAGTPGADQPLLAMCDSARCPQATHHPCHREIWAEAVTQHETFIAALPRSQATERTRLQKELDRARHVLAGIDAATPATTGDPSWDA